MEIAAPTCSVYACHDAATFVLLPDDEHHVAAVLPKDCLCAQHWLQLRAFDPERAYRYVPARYAANDASGVPAESAGRGSDE